jgi:class 3 adenylate cyclase/tetratricopeptide (TPR) repeat protein
VLDWLANDPACRFRTIDGTLAFVDVSGFTALTERFSGHGRAGLEEVNDIIGAAIGELLSIAESHGGQLLKWGGDAVLLLFSGTRAGERGCRATWLMSKAMNRVGAVRTSLGRVSLGVSAGLFSGAVDLYLVGDSHRELLVVGPAATATAELEKAAEEGEVLVSASLASQLPAALTGSEKSPGVLLRAAPGAEVIESIPSAEAPVVDPSPLFAPVIRERLLGGGETDEHRYACIAFLEFRDIDALRMRRGPEHVAEAIDVVVRRAQEAATQFEVALHSTDISIDGGKILLTGAIPLVRGRDEERLLRAVLAIVRGYDGPLRLRVGLNAGRFFVRDVGRGQSRIYSISGDAVNLAARVMSRADFGDVLATQDFLDRVASPLAKKEIAPFRAKGKSEPVRAAVVLSVEDSDSETSADDEGPFVGRDVELLALRQSAESAHGGDGRALEIVAAAGLGKSRLLREAQREWNLPTRNIACEGYGEAPPYAPLASLLAALMTMPAEADSRTIIAALSDEVRTHVPELVEWLPLLAAVFDISVPPTPSVERLDPRYRRERIEGVVLRFLDALIASPTAILFEDAHATDDATRAFLTRMANGIATRPWLLVITRRPESDEIVPESPFAIRLPLESLRESESTSLLQSSIDGVALLPRERDALLARAAGNPLFLRELVAAFRESRSLESLPDSVESLFAQQVDRLARNDSSVLRAAAVLGIWFDTSEVDLLLGEPVAPAVWERLQPFVVSEFGQVRFRHALLRDAAYEGLSFRRRRELHERAADAIANRTGQPEEHAGVLSLHYFHAERYAETWSCALVAGEKSAHLYANSEAAVFYRRALAAARKMSPVPRDELAGVWEALGDVTERAGEYLDAASAYAIARTSSVAASDRARLLRKSGIVHERNGRYRPALACFSRGRKLLANDAARSAAREHCELAIAYAGIRFRQGRLADTLEWARAAREEALVIDDRPAIAHALYLEHIASSSMGRPLEGAGERALAIYEEIGDLVGQGNALNNLGVDAYFRGAWDEALDLYARSAQAREQVGDVMGAATEQNNIGEILSDQGHYARAEELFRSARESWLASQYPVGLAIATSNLGRCATRDGRLKEAAALLHDAREGFRTIGSAAYELETDARLIELELFSSPGPDVLRSAERILDGVQRLGGADALETFARRLLALAWAHQEAREAAVVEVTQSIDRARSQDERFELALGLATRATLSASMTGRSASRDAREAVALFEALGVVDTPAASIADRWPKAGRAFH